MNITSTIKRMPVLLMLLASACSKDPVTPAQPSVTTPGNQLSKIEYANNTAEMTYNADGTLAAVTNKFAANTSVNTYNFAYASGKLSQVSFGGKWKYYYNGNDIVKVETLNEAGVVKYQVELTYTASGKIAQRTESLVNAFGATPHMRTNLTYNTAGNITKLEIYQFINQDWKKSEEIQFTEYDTNVNTSDPFENFPYLPANVYSTNNPVKQVYMDDQGTVLGNTTYAYTYDTSKRPLTRTSTEKFIGFPEVVETMKLFY